MNEITSFRKLVKESQIKIKEALRDFSNLQNSLDVEEKKIGDENDIDTEELLTLVSTVLRGA